MYTVEGNTSDGKSIVENGGEVCQKKYTLSTKRIMGYGRPEWGDPSEAEPEDDSVDAPVNGETEELPPVDEGVEVEYLCNATVEAPSGRVNFRQRPDKTGKPMKGMNKVKNGEEVKIKSKDDTWAAVDYGKYHGYIMLEFLVIDGESDTDEDAPDEEIAPGYTVETVYYTTVKGDTLWGLAKRFYGNGLLYKKIMQANGMKNTIVRPGMKLKIPDVEGVG